MSTVSPPRIELRDIAIEEFAPSAVQFLHALVAKAGKLRAMHDTTTNNLTNNVN
jgi:hypothetical protein